MLECSAVLQQVLRSSLVTALHCDLAGYLFVFTLGSFFSKPLLVAVVVLHVPHVPSCEGNFAELADAAFI